MRRKPRPPEPDCGCTYQWGSFGRLDGFWMGEGWLRTGADPECIDHGAAAEAMHEARWEEIRSWPPVQPWTPSSVERCPKCGFPTSKCAH